LRCDTYGDQRSRTAAPAFRTTDSEENWVRTANEAEPEIFDSTCSFLADGGCFPGYTVHSQMRRNRPTTRCHTLRTLPTRCGIPLPPTPTPDAVTATVVSYGVVRTFSAPWPVLFLACSGPRHLPSSITSRKSVGPQALVVLRPVGQALGAQASRQLVRTPRLFVVLVVRATASPARQPAAVS
jgi:hypothetical protein